MSCPNSGTGPHACMCAEHHLGLLAYTVNEHHHQSLARALNELRGPQVMSLSVLTFDPEPAPNVVPLPKVVECDGSYECQCAKCAPATAHRVQQGGRRDDHPFGGMPVKIRRAA